MSKFATLSVFVATTIFLGASANAGEVTGNHKDVDPNGRSICSYSGLNDAPAGDSMGPPGKTQSFGQSVRMGLRDPTNFAGPDTFSFHPGYFCNATNVDVSDWHPQ